MPVQYEGVLQEHRAVRQGVGVFDVSHMGQVETSGPQAAELLQHVLSNDVSTVKVGGAQYSVLCREDGGVLDDLFTYRLAADRWLTVTNAANHTRDLAWILRHADGFDAEVHDVADRYAMLAVQGPGARECVQALSDGPLPVRFTVGERRLLGATALVCGTGYTGEDGVELLLDGAQAPAVWDELLRRGATPVGLAARDTLRLEACFHLYGNDLTEERGPIEAGLGWCCKEDTGFVGSDAVRAVRAAGPAEKLVPLRFTGAGIPRQGNPVVAGGEVGELGHALADARGRHRLAYVRAGAGRPRHRGRGRRARQAPRRRRRREAPVRVGGGPRWPRPATPTTCCTTPSTTGPRSTATWRPSA